jgi:hypothetical protein
LDILEIQIYKQRDFALKMWEGGGDGLMTSCDD